MLLEILLKENLVNDYLLVFLLFEMLHKLIATGYSIGAEICIMRFGTLIIIIEGVEESRVLSQKLLVLIQNVQL